MGRKQPRTQSKLVVLGIILSCCFALYCLVLKINRLLELSEMDRAAPTEAVIASVVYLNSSFSSDSSASVQFLFHSQGEPPADLYCDSRNPVGKLTSPVTTQLLGPSRLYLGTCDVLEPGFSIELKNQEFSTMLDPDLFPRRQHSAVCLSLAHLFEDASTLKALLTHYGREADIVDLYVSSYHDSIHREVEKLPNVNVVFWPILQSTRRTVQEGRIQLEADAYYQSLEASFADCWLRHAPLVKKVTFLELQSFNFLTGPKREEFGTKVDLFRREWRVKSIFRGKVERVQEKSLTVSVKCSGHCEKRTVRLKEEDQKTIKPALITVKRTSSPDPIQNSYSKDVGRCTTFRGFSSRAKKILEDAVDGLKNLPDPCLIRGKRKDYKCRVASHITKRMFSGQTKVSVVQKRSVLKFYDGYR